MKSTIAFFAVITFSALLLPPIGPKDYPTQSILDERTEIVLNQNKIDDAISKIEQRLAIDSLHLESIKNKRYE
ncbi:MAG: hypothetical protein BGO88_04820 [Flavobacterium sp. 38-13]|uniref:hypothetical protein n=1 Tax=Flavobacterium sp. 38-13 TaxID=1896168 RepID=UPI000966E431|nr:hypothetical protein [Flavobacterium sp. 38-13]OJX55540.1 MAG: hypothetical protein BGO88_04820 [Flavobacterium sp. 38-13]